MALPILRLLNFNMLTGILKDMEKEKILTKFKLEVHIYTTYLLCSLELNLIRVDFRSIRNIPMRKNPDKNNFIRIRVCR